MSALKALHAHLEAWLIEAAYPLWAHSGIDARNGGFVEALDQSGNPLAQPRRARIHPRQAFAFAQAGELGWRSDVATIVSRGMDYFTRYYQRPDRLFRALADAHGAPLDDSALLYDQAFALLGYAAAATALDARSEYESRALELGQAIESRFSANAGTFYSLEQPSNYRESNPHMHLLEAYLAWAEIGFAPRWADGVRSLVDVALSRFIRNDSGAIGESYLASGAPSPGDRGRVIEPGHQFEWAWLLLRCQPWHRASLRATALQLISIGEQFGVRDGVAINALHDDFTVADGNARFWPQTERLKAALLAATLTDEGRYWTAAEAAAASFAPYLATRIPGLWFDVRLPNGKLVDSPAPASTFYHLVGAVMALKLAPRP
jgi:mannose/cellobiose epimerase-like protein (N-acyl-D-glucosamine 2-epimerase family)